ncbi:MULTISPECIES: flagellar hook assembly protein FlgD [unclassified Sphingomonas]|uniref:flagellar hook assembly protein FlgD n=1 Tax=unclassified Sphingomonas TaxID=196159 RepID=UPI002150BFDC|nr:MULTISPECIES: flagellar hook capping FlgD N-terminal domain-containing protein [unclassified Sphingomonas]MCR5869351.1 flagellar hook assembly protein FlgD [Sphingomonas sp. J344]UUX98919.1 flagellar hook assembly protein FlgD [Sphingomonas sp. J315]
MAVDAATAANAATSTNAGNALSKLAADSTMFLKLLTTQMQNQDPMDPMDTSEYTAQLVQFSQIEQSIQQNASLKSILTALTSDNLVGAASVVGKVASFGSDQAGLTADSPAQWTYATTRPADSVVATIKNASGATVHTINLTGSEGELVWDGTLPNGTRARDGEYKLEIAAKDTTGSSVPVSISARGLVKEVAQDASGMTFQVNGVFYNAATLVRLTQ